MNIKIKIIIVLAVIVTIISVFTVNIFAIETENVVYPTEIVLENDTAITFANNGNIVFSGNRTYTLRFKYPAQSYVQDYIIIESNSVIGYKREGYSNSAVYTNGVWTSQNNRYVTVIGGQTITDEYLIKFLVDNASGLPAPPPPPSIEPTLWENVQDFFDGVLDNGTLIVSWMTATPIALIPLALYCVIVIFAIFKRFVKG